MNKYQKICRIISVAFHLFSEKGFSEPSMRQISQQAGISLGLIDHYFGSKRKLGLLLFELLVRRARAEVEKYVDMDADPLLFDAALVRVNYTQCTSPQYKRFFLDCLEADIFFDFLALKPNLLIRKEMEEYGVELSDDILLLYGKFVPYNLEKTLSINKEKGFFSSIGYDEIPDYIFLSGVERFLPGEVLKATVIKAREIAGTILYALPEVSEEDISEYAAAFAEELFSNKQKDLQDCVNAKPGE